MKLSNKPGKVPTQYEVTTGGLAYDATENKMYTKLQDGGIHLIDFGGLAPGGALEIKGTDTIANILLKTGLPGDIWIASNSDATAIPPGVAGDGYSWDSDTSTWVNVGPIRGPQGPTGTPGTDGADGADGDDGEDTIVKGEALYADILTKPKVVGETWISLDDNSGASVSQGDGLRWSGTAWANIGRLLGNDGADGINGLPGGGPSYRNKFINGDFSVWQRSDAFTIDHAQSKFAADRWIVGCWSTTTGNCWVYQEELTQEHTGCIGMVIDPQSLGGASSPNYNLTVLQNIENVCTFAGQDIVLSIEIDNRSAAFDSTFLLRQYFGAGGSASVNTDGVMTIPNGRSIVTKTMSVPSIHGKTITTGDALQAFIIQTRDTPNFTIISAQIEQGTVATGYEKKMPGKELHDCQRYFLRWQGQGIEGHNPASPYDNITVGLPINWPNVMRVNPTTSYSFDDALNNVNGGNTCGNFDLSDPSDVISVGESSKYIFNLQIRLEKASTGSCWFAMGSTDFIEADAEI